MIDPLDRFRDAATNGFTPDRAADRISTQIQAMPPGQGTARRRRSMVFAGAGTGAVACGTAMAFALTGTFGGPNPAGPVVDDVIIGADHADQDVTTRPAAHYVDRAIKALDDQSNYILQTTTTSTIGSDTQVTTQIQTSDGTASRWVMDEEPEPSVIGVGSQEIKVRQPDGQWQYTVTDTIANTFTRFTPDHGDLEVPLEEQIAQNSSKIRRSLEQLRTDERFALGTPQHTTINEAEAVCYDTTFTPSPETDAPLPLDDTPGGRFCFDAHTNLPLLTSDADPDSTDPANPANGTTTIYTWHEDTPENRATLFTPDLTGLTEDLDTEGLAN